MLVSASNSRASRTRQFGAGVTGAFEGWFANADGGRAFLVGYFNRNTAQELDVPIGPNNRIEPGGPDMGQPTHFLPGPSMGHLRHPCAEGFHAADQRLTWTIVVNGQTTSIPLRLHPDYMVSPFTDVAVKNTPPVVQRRGERAVVPGTGRTARHRVRTHHAAGLAAGIDGVGHRRRQVRERDDGAAA